MKRYLACFLNFVLILCLNGDILAKSTVTIPKVKVKPTSNIKDKLTTHHTEITQASIKESSVNTISSLLAHEQSMVRVTESSGDSTEPVLSIRGFGDNAVANTLILVDGFPLTNPSLQAPNINALNLTEIKKISIFSGSAGTRWGNQAIGGVVNITSKRPTKFYANAMLSQGSYQNNFYNLSAGAVYENFFIKGNVAFLQTHNFRAHNAQQRFNVSTQFGMNYAKSLWLVNLQHYDTTVEFPGGLTYQHYHFDPETSSITTNYSHSVTHLGQFLTKQIINPHWLLETRLAFNHTNSDGYVFLPFDRTDLTQFFNPQLIGQLNNHKLLIGYMGEISQYQFHNTLTSSITQAKQHNYYLRLVTKLNQQLTSTLGMRYAQQSNDINDPSSAIHLVNYHTLVSEQKIAYQLNSAWQVYLRRDGNFIFPKANQIIFTPTKNSSLKLQTGTSYESAVSYQGDNKSIQLSLYQLAIRNELAFDPSQTRTRPFGSYTNFSKTLRRGFSIASQFKLTSKTNFNTQLNYVAARFAEGKDRDKLIPAVPAWNANINLNYQLATSWKINYALAYTGKRYASNNTANTGKQLSGYSLHSLALHYSWQKLRLSFEVNNLLNQRYASYTVYKPKTNANSYYPAAGRNYLFTVKVNLN